MEFLPKKHILLLTGIFLGTVLKLGGGGNKIIRLCRILIRKSFEVKEVCDHPVPLETHLTGKYPCASLEYKSQLSISCITGIDIS